MELFFLVNCTVSYREIEYVNEFSTYCCKCRVDDSISNTASPTSLALFSQIAATISSCWRPPFCSTLSSSFPLALFSFLLPLGDDAILNQTMLHHHSVQFAQKDRTCFVCSFVCACLRACVRGLPFVAARSSHSVSHSNSHSNSKAFQTIAIFRR